ncbi:MAG: hypothetical protein KAG14_01880 [Mycoplasmataceae bacterium]|nr:hypothetical protein [Mycoplasmataceae bacterium]
MGLKGEYKVPSTRKKEVKDTKNLKKDYVKGHINGWNNNKSRTIISTNTSEWSIYGQKMYFSIVIEAESGYILDLSGSKYNDKQLMMSSTEIGCSKIWCKFIIQSDNAASCKSKDYMDMVKNLGGISSFGRPAKCQDNWLSEVHIGLIKDKYLRNTKT